MVDLQEQRAYADAVPRPVGRCDDCPVRALAFCAALDRDGLRELEPLVAGRRADTGEVLIEEGRRCGELMTVAAGVLEIHKSLPDGRRQVIGFRFPGDLVTYSRGDAASTVTVRAVKPSQLCCIGHEALRGFARAHPEVDRALLALASDEIASEQEQLLTVGRRTPMEKVAAFLLDMDRRATGPRRRDGAIELPMLRPEIADYLGLKTETVCRVFTKLKSDGLVALPRPHRVVLRDRAALKALAGAR